jgi:hypothetical protein
MPRAWAESFAHLNATNPPDDLPSERWQRFIDDIGRFLDGPFCAVALALGWEPLDLLGCDRDRQFAAIERAALLWVLDGGRLVMLADDAATIETRNGERQIWRPKSTLLSGVPAWERAP